MVTRLLPPRATSLTPPPCLLCLIKNELERDYRTRLGEFVEASERINRKTNRRFSVGQVEAVL